jgi:hypothetical protein
MFLYLFFVFFLWLSTLRPHILVIPYPYYNREYAVKSTKSILVNQFPIGFSDFVVCPEKKWEVVVNGIGFYRLANRAYDMSSNNKYLAAAFHGASHFDLSDLSPNSKILYIKNNSEGYKNLLNDNEYIRYEGFVTPVYDLEDYGVVLALDYIQIVSESVNFLCQLRLPMGNKIIHHENQWNDIKYNDNSFGDDRLYFDSLNKYFRVRSDYLIEKSIIPEIRSVVDFKKIEGATFLVDNYDNYFLEKPCFLNRDHSGGNETVENLYCDSNSAFDLDCYKNNQNLLNKKLIIDQWYAMTEFNEMSIPTKNSLLLYDQLISLNKKLPDAVLQDVTKGAFLGKKYHWNSVIINYIAPLDIQCNITKIFDCQKIIVQGLFALVVPIKNQFTIDEDSYIAKNFFKDQYAFRLGSQITYDWNRYYKFLFYGSWQYYLPDNQIIPAIFENVSAYGLSPLYLKGKVSWHEFYVASHCVIKYNDNIGFDLGYQYIYKSGDSVIPECTHFYLINGEKYKLDYSLWSKFSNSIANLLSFNYYYYYGLFQFDLGIKVLIAGKNVINLKEFSFRVGFDF